MRAHVMLFAGFIAFQAAGAQVQPDPVVPLRPPLEYEDSSSGLQNPKLDGGPIEMEMGDVNGDGFVDILSIGDHGSPYINTQEHGVMVWFGDGSGTGWSVFMNGNFGYGGIALGDVNNDGLMDVGYGMHHDYSSSDFGDQLIEVALGDGTGKNWTPWDDQLATHGQSWGMHGTDFADVDGDGDLDLVSVSFGAGDGLHVYLNNGDGTWFRSFGFLGGNSSCQVLFGDVNGDGHPDIAAGHQAGTIWLGDGTGAFINGDGNLPGTSYGFDGPDLGDVNGDGCQDLSLCTGSGAVQVWLFDGPGRWKAFSAGLPSTSGYSMTQLCDLDGDGRLDLLAFGKAQGTVWQLDKSRTWVKAAGFITGTPGYAEALRTGVDVDYNGRPDIVLVCDEGSWPNDRNRLHLFRERSEPRMPEVRLTFPQGSEVLHRGAAVFIDWVSAVPNREGGASTVSLKISTSGANGPWSGIASGLPNNGRYQWRIPAALPASTDCRIRIRMTAPSGSASFVTTKSFTLD